MHCNVQPNCGPDPYGYVLRDSRAATGPGSYWLGLAGSTSAQRLEQLDNRDDTYTAVQLPFDFPYYGRSYRTVYPSTNGLLGLGAGNSSTGGQIPSSYQVAMIAALWEDLDLRCNRMVHCGMYYATGSFASGSGTIQYAAFEWTVVPFYSEESQSFSFELVLFSDGRFDINYGVMSGRLDEEYVTIGFQDHTGRRFISYLYARHEELDGRTLRGYPPGNTANTSPGALVQDIAVPGPAAPTLLTATDTMDDAGGSIVLSWTPSASAGVLGQHVYRAQTQNDEDYQLVARLPGNAHTSYVLTGLSNGTEYSFVVRAWDGSGESVNSVVATAFPVNDTALPPVLEDDTLDVGYVSNEYHDYLDVDFGAGPFDFTVTAGALPPGLALRYQEDEIEIQGVPTATGAFTFTLEARDALGRTSSRAYTIVVRERFSAAQSSLTISPASLPADGTAAATATLVLRDPAGVPLAGATVYFSAAPWSGVTISPSNVMTDLDGRATVTVRSWTAGDVLVRAEYLGARLDAAPVTFTPGAPSYLSFISLPQRAAAGAPFTAQVEIRDNNGNRTTSSNNVTVSIASGYGPSAAVLSGTTTVAATNGVATFSGLAIDLASPYYQLSAVASSCVECDAYSSTFAITGAAPAAPVITAPSYGAARRPARVEQTAGAPTVTLGGSSSNIRTGTTVFANGSGFPASTTVAFTWNGTASATAAVTDASGSFSTSVVVPTAPLASNALVVTAGGVSGTLTYSPVLIAGTAPAGTTIDLRRMGGGTLSSAIAADGSGSWSFGWWHTYGENATVIAYATDATGAMSGSSNAVSFHVDGEAPYLVSARRGTGGVTVAVRLSDPVQPAAAITGFGLSSCASGCPIAIAAAARDAAHPAVVILTLAVPTTATELHLSYSGGNVTDHAGNPLAAIPATLLDETAPSLVTATASGQVLTLAFDEPVVPESAITGFSVRVNDTATGVLSAQRDASTSVVKLTLASAVASGQTVTLSYAPGNLTDRSGNAFAAVTDRAVTNSTSTPSIARIEPSSATVGAAVQVLGQRFAGGASVSLTLDGAAIATGPVTVQPNGSFVATLTVPAVPGGSHSLVASAGGLTSPTAFLYIDPSIALSASSGPVGTPITVTGTGFKAATAVAFAWDGAALASSGGSVTTDAAGGFTGTVVIPAATCLHTLSATAYFGAGAPFDVRPCVRLSQASAVPGSTVTLSGGGLPASTAVSVTFDGAALATTPAAPATNSSGAFAASFVVPAAAPGSHAIVLTAGTASVPLTLNVPTPWIWSYTSSANVGASVTVYGESFPIGAAVALTWDGASVATGSTTGTGSFTITFTVPASVAGTHTVAATAGASTASTTMSVAPKISLSPASGTIGTTVTVNGTGFGATVPVTLAIAGETVTHAAITTAATGSFSGSFTTAVPVPGLRTVSASGGTRSATASFSDTSPNVMLSAGSSTTVTGGMRLQFDVHLSHAAPAGGLTVTFATNNSNALVSPASITFAPGTFASYGGLSITGAAVGTTTLTSTPSASGWAGATTTVNVTTGVFYLYNGSHQQPVGTTQNMQVWLCCSGTAASAITVQLGTTGLATVPATTTIQAGMNVSDWFPVTAGSTTGTFRITVAAAALPGAPSAQLKSSTGFVIDFGIVP